MKGLNGDDLQAALPGAPRGVWGRPSRVPECTDAMRAFGPAMASGDDGRVCEAAQTAKAMEGLLAVSTPLCTGTHSAVLCDLSAELVSVDGQSMRHIGFATHWASVAFTCTGDVIGLALFSVIMAGRLRQWWDSFRQSAVRSGRRGSACV